MAGTHKDVLDTNEDVMQMKALFVKITEQRESQGRPTTLVNTVYGKITISAEDQDTVYKAEAVLLEASNNSIVKKEPTDASHKILQEKVSQAIEGIEKKNVKVEGAQMGSVILEFKCLSLAAILELIDYYYSPSFQRRIDEVAQALEDIIGKEICVIAVGIDRQSLQDVIIKMDGRGHPLEVIEEEKAVHSINEVSYDQSGKPVTLHTSTDMKQMRNEIYLIMLIPDEQANESQESYTKRIAPLDALIKSQNIKSGLKQLNAKQDIPDLEPEDELMKHSRSSLYRQQRFRNFPIIADEEARLSSAAKLRPTCVLDDLDDVLYNNMMGFQRSSFNERRSLTSPGPYLPHSSSFWPGRVKQDSTISACAILPNERLVIADKDGLSVVNIATGLIEQKKTLHRFRLNIHVADIAVLPNDQVAVTLHSDGEILILSTRDMQLIRSIDINRPSGITCHQDELYVVCLTYDICLPCVYILNLQGILLRRFKIDKLITIDNNRFRFSKIAISKDARSVYITDDRSLIRYSEDSQVIATYSLTGLHPIALSTLDDSFLLVVSENIQHCDIYNIHHISEDLQQGYVQKIEERFLPYICPDPVNNRIYVIYREGREDTGPDKNVTIKVFYFMLFTEL